MPAKLTLASLAGMIDHSLLHPTLTDKDIAEGCELALKCGCATACIKPYSIPLARKILHGSKVGICAVIGFPHGNSSIGVKAIEAESAALAGSTEIDMVVNAGNVLGGDWEYVSREIKAVNDVVTGCDAILKVIFENDYLQDSHIIRLCRICSGHKVAFVKTSTGYGFVKQDNGMYSYKGATDDQLKLMRKHCPKSVQIKAAGGVRTFDDCVRVIELGVTRIGASATESIMSEARKRGLR